MKILRRFLGVFVMIAGMIGLLISLGGLVGIWFARPIVQESVRSTISTLESSLETSRQVMDTTYQALGATVASVDALSDMLGTTALTLEDTKPVLGQMNTMMEVQLPSTLEAATGSLRASQEAARSLESTIKSLDTFRMVMGGTPFLSAFMPADQQYYNPQKPLAESLGEVATSLEDMPATFVDMAVNMDKADDNLDAIQANLVTMSGSVAMISGSLREYQSMVGQSQASVQSLETMLAGIQANLVMIVNIASWVLFLLFIWMLAVQVVVFSQGWELYQGTAGRMESSPVEAPPVTPATAG